MAEMNKSHTQRDLLKPTLILSTLLFLLVAPAPDSHDLAEMTADFLIPDNHSGLMAAAEAVQPAEDKL